VISFGAGLLLLSLGGFVLPAHGQECQALSGAWTSSLAVRDLFELNLTVRESGYGSFEVEIGTSQGSGVVPVWLDGRHLRFQSARASISFDGMVSDDGSRIGGFVQSGSHVARVSLLETAGAGTRTWATEWTPLGVFAEAVRFEPAASAAISSFETSDSRGCSDTAWSAPRAGCEWARRTSTCGSRVSSARLAMSYL